MKVRIKFAKYGAMKFIGHLDVMRYFQKAFRRAEIDNEYTKGFNPHQIMSFAAPLGVGLTSDSEYVDVSLNSSDTPEIMLERINNVLTEGFKVTKYIILKDREANQRGITAMSLVTAADYLVSLKDGYSIGGFNQTTFRKAFEDFMLQSEILVDKKTKTSEKTVDIKPMISMAAYDEAEYKSKLSLLKVAEVISENEQASLLKEEFTSMADMYNNGIKVFLQLDTGSASNLKPELVMEAFCFYHKLPFEIFAWQVHRLEVYTRDEESNRLISLDKLER